MKKIGSIKRRTIGANDELIKFEPLSNARPLPLLAQPALADVDLIAWAAANRDLIEQQLLKHGGILFRGFPLQGATDLERFIQVISTELLEYRERSSPRRQVINNIYTSTEYPADQSIFLHNENSYQHAWPLRLFFFCDIAPLQGGETPIADCRRVYQHIDEEIRARFIEKGVMYLRNFRDHLGLSWQTVFQTDDRDQVAEYCRAAGIEIEWRPNNSLRTRQIRPAIATHPRTGEQVWFNHATFFHISTFEPSTRGALLAEFKIEDLPSNTYYGDGSAIEPEVLDQLRNAYQQEAIYFSWQQGDLLMLDNMLTAHGRAPYRGERKILVGMSEPISRD